MLFKVTRSADHESPYFTGSPSSSNFLILNDGFDLISLQLAVPFRFTLQDAQSLLLNEQLAIT